MPHQASQSPNIYLEEQQTDVLDQLAAAEGISRAKLIRRMINQVLNQHSNNLADNLAAIQNSFGVLNQSGPDLPAREEDDRQRHQDRMWKLAE